MQWLLDLVTNPFLVVPISSWMVAQVIKAIIHAIVNKKFDKERLFGDGGMPRCHSATVMSLAVFMGLYFGFGSYQFAICMILAVIVGHDAMGVRLETGKQAVIINEIIESINVLVSDELPDVKLKELVGHTPLQVYAGALVGLVNALIMYYFVF